MRLFECCLVPPAALLGALLAVAITALPASDMRAEIQSVRPSNAPKQADNRPLFDYKDEVAALEAVQVALTEVGDGSSYVWYRHGGRLSGVVNPTQSFKDTHGRVCRHIVVTLSDANRQKRTEGIACRLADGAWELDG